MAPADRLHDRELLDRLDAIDGIAIAMDVFRITRRGRDPTKGYSANGRWSRAAEIEVLYTASKRQGALAEIGYRLSLEPIWPSKLEHEMARLNVKLDNVCDLSSLDLLEELEVDIKRYETFEYRATQAISAAAKFLEFDAIMVPSARHNSDNLVIYTDQIDAAFVELVASETVNWNQWRVANTSLPSRSRG